MLTWQKSNVADGGASEIYIFSLTCSHKEGNVKCVEEKERIWGSLYWDFVYLEKKVRFLEMFCEPHAAALIQMCLSQLEHKESLGEELGGIISSIYKIN
jgi:hypothetical protein